MMKKFGVHWKIFMSIQTLLRRAPATVATPVQKWNRVGLSENLWCLT